MSNMVTYLSLFYKFTGSCMSGDKILYHTEPMRYEVNNRYLIG